MQIELRFYCDSQLLAVPLEAFKIRLQDVSVDFNTRLTSALLSLLRFRLDALEV